MIADALIQSFGIDDFEGHDGGVHQALAGMVEIDRHPVAIDRLHLPNAPVGLRRMAHVRAGNDCAFHDAS